MATNYRHLIEEFGEPLGGTVGPGDQVFVQIPTVALHGLKGELLAMNGVKGLLIGPFNSATKTMKVTGLTRVTEHRVAMGVGRTELDLPLDNLMLLPGHDPQNDKAWLMSYGWPLNHQGLIFSKALEWQVMRVALEKWPVYQCTLCSIPGTEVPDVNPEVSSLEYDNRFVETPERKDANFVLVGYVPTTPDVKPVAYIVFQAQVNVLRPSKKTSALTTRVPLYGPGAILLRQDKQMTAKDFSFWRSVVIEQA